MKHPQRIYYIGERHGEKHSGIMTVATEVQNDGGLKMGFSFCSLKDRFVKATGREMALEQMNSNNALYTDFTGHSADDIKTFFNEKMVDEKKPHIWRHRKLANIVKTGLTVLEVK